MLVTPFGPEEPKLYAADESLPCEILFGNFNRYKSSSEAGLHSSFNPCGDESNLVVKLDVFRETLREAMPVLKGKIVGLPVSHEVLQEDFEAILNSLHQWKGVTKFVFGAAPDWDLLNAPDSTGSNQQKEVLRLLALMQAGRKSVKFGFVPFGFLGIIHVASHLKDLQVALQVAQVFAPKPPCVVISYAGCESSDLIEQSFDLIEKAGCSQRVVLLVPYGTHMLKILRSTFMKCASASLYDTIDPRSGKRWCFWPNEGCCTTWSELKHLLDKHEARNILRTSGLFFQQDHMTAGGAGLRTRLEAASAAIDSVDPARRISNDIFQFAWKPVTVEKVRVATFRCDVCKECCPLYTGEEPYRKFDYVYCSIDCLTKHRKQKFSPL